LKPCILKMQIGWALDNFYNKELSIDYQDKIDK
jgi:hypothetical protein